MIVVMPNGNPGQQAARTLNIPEKAINWRSEENRDAYVRSLCTEIVPFIEKYFRVIPKPSSRAIAGLSMGGGHTISASNLYPELFDYICPLSAAGRAIINIFIIFFFHIFQPFASSRFNFRTIKLII